MLTLINWVDFYSIILFWIDCIMLVIDSILHNLHVKIRSFGDVHELNKSPLAIRIYVLLIMWPKTQSIQKHVALESKNTSVLSLNIEMKHLTVVEQKSKDKGDVIAKMDKKSGSGWVCLFSGSLPKSFSLFLSFSSVWVRQEIIKSAQQFCIDFVKTLAALIDLSKHISPSAREVKQTNKH